MGVVNSAPPPVPPAILAATTDQRVQLAMLMGSHMEGGWGPNYGIGDNGTSFGPYQMHVGGALGDLPGTLQQQITEATNPTDAVAGMLSNYQGAVNQIPQSEWQSNPEQAGEQAAVLAERPAEPYYQSQGQGSVDAAYQAAVAVMGGSGGVATAGTAGGTAAPPAAASGQATLTGDIAGIPGTSALNPSTYVTDAVNALKAPLARAGLLFAALILFVVGIILVAGGTPGDVSKAAGAATGKDRTAEPIDTEGLDEKMRGDRADYEDANPTPEHTAQVAQFHKDNAAANRATGGPKRGKIAGDAKALEGEAAETAEAAAVA